MEQGFAKKLADVEQEVRDNAIRALNVWIKEEGSHLQYEEYLKLWKGLHYSIWMADKPKYQHELAERLANLVKCFPLEVKEDLSDEKVEVSVLLFIRAFWETITREWKGIDRLRLNKYYYLMQQFMKVGMELIRDADFDREFAADYFQIIFEFPLNLQNDKIPAGIKIFFIENYIQSLRELDELFDESLTVILLSPLIQSLVEAQDKSIRKTLENSFASMVDHHIQLLEAVDDTGKRLDAEEECDTDDGMDISQDHFDFGLLATTLFEIGAESSVNQSNRKILYKLSELFAPFSVEDGCLDDCCCDHDESESIQNHECGH